MTRFLLGSDSVPPESALAIWLQDIEGMQFEIEPREAGATELLWRTDNKPAFNWLRQSDYRIPDEDGTLPGDGILLHYGAADKCTAKGLVRLTNVRLERALFHSRIPDIEGQLVGRSPSNSTALRLLQAYLDALLANGIPADPALVHVVSEHIVDLIAASLRSGEDNPEPAAQRAISASRLAAAKTDIRTHLSDPALSAKQVAQRLGLSERSIYLLFERSGLSFAPFVTSERLKLATAMLLDPARRQDRIGDIALAAGFGDLSTFNRSFRRRYGRTPSSLRRSKIDHPDRGTG